MFAWQRATLFACLIGAATTPAVAMPLATCLELTGGGAVIDVERDDAYRVVAVAPGLGTLPLTYDSSRRAWSASRGTWPDPEWLTLEIAPVNGRFVGVLFALIPDGAGVTRESIFKCVDSGLGAASSNGG